MIYFSEVLQLIKPVTEERQTQLLGNSLPQLRDSAAILQDLDEPRQEAYTLYCCECHLH